MRLKVPTRTSESKPLMGVSSTTTLGYLGKVDTLPTSRRNMPMSRSLRVVRPGDRLGIGAGPRTLLIAPSGMSTAVLTGTALTECSLARV